LIFKVILGLEVSSKDKQLGARCDRKPRSNAPDYRGIFGVRTLHHLDERPSALTQGHEFVSRQLGAL